MVRIDTDSAQVLKCCRNFFDEIGIRYKNATLLTTGFLPGLLIAGDTVVIDEEKLLHSGDLLHEAGHMAVVPAVDRPTLNLVCPLGEREQSAAEEMMAIAWSYAACLHLRLPPEVVFHSEGYRGGGQSIIENFSNNRLFGVSMLEWCGMTKEPRTGRTDSQTFPQMTRWLRD